MSNAPGKKAELDKDGISFDFNKAQLDQDGISLTDAAEDLSSRETDTQTQPSETAAQAARTPTRRIIIFSLIAGAAALCLAIGTVLLQTAEKPPAHIPATVHDPGPSLATPSSDGEVLLDPFMVLFDSNDPGESGVVFAQVSLQVAPGMGPNIFSRLFDIRSLIYQRISANAGIYSKNELAAMIRDDLKDLNVKDVAFIQYEKR